MSGAETTQAAEATGLIRFGDATGVPKDAFSVPVAWPVTAWRVLVPAPRRTGSDPLQRAILRLIAAGCVDPHAISAWLDIPADLVRALIGRYTSEEYLKRDEVTAISDRGRNLLKQDDAITYSAKSHCAAWILRDDWSGDIIPFLIEDNLRWYSPEGRAGFTVLHGGRLCTDRPQPLRIREALEAYRSYVNRVRDCQRTNDTPDTYAVLTESDGPRTIDVDRAIPGIVQLLWECSERVYVPLWLYFCADDPRAWHVATGFSLPPINGWFASKLAWACGRLPELLQQIEGWASEAVEIFPPRPTLDETESRAVAEFPFLAERPELTDTRRLLARAYRAAALYESNPENIDVYLTRCYLALEALLSACLSASPQAVQATRFLCEDSFVDQLRDYADRLSVELPKGFCNPLYGKKARRAAAGRGENLRDRAIALLYFANHDRRSPARQVFVAHPDLLVHIDTVTRYRNTHGSHYEPAAGLRDEPAMAAQVERSTRYVIGALGDAFFGNRDHVKTQAKVSQ